MALLPSSKNIDIMNPGHLSQLILEIEGRENIDRKKHAWRDYQVFGGNQSWYVQRKIQELYPETHGQFRIGDVSIAKAVTKKIAKSYKESPQRVLENETETEAYSAISDQFKFSNSWKEFDEIFNLHKYALLWLTFVNPEGDTAETTGQYVLSALAPFEYDLVRDEITGEPLIFSLSYPDNTITGQVGTNDQAQQAITENQADTEAETKRYSFWSKTRHVQVIRTRKVTDDGLKIEIKFLPIPGNEGNVSPTPGRLPIAFLSREQAVDYPIANNLGNQSVSWNVDYSNLRTATADQGHGQLVISHPQGQKLTKVHMGMHHAIELPQSKKEGDPSTTAEYISAEPDLSGQLDVLKFGAIQILNDHGIQAKGGVEGGTEEFASGFDRLLSMADVHDLIVDNQALYSETPEQDIFLVLKAFEESLNRKTFTKSKKVVVHYAKPQPMQSRKELLDEIEQELKLGTIEEWEKFIKLNPNMTEDEARKKLEKVKKGEIADRAAMIEELGNGQTDPEEPSEPEE